MNVGEFVREGRPVEELTRTVQEEGIDLLVLPAHSEWRLERFLFGRANEELTRKMLRSIMLVKKEPEEAA